MSQNENVDIAGELKKLIRKRGAMKASLTNLTNFVNKIKDRTKLENIEYLQLKERISRSPEMLTSFSDCQNDIEAIVEDVEPQYSERTSFENEFYAITAIARNILDSNASTLELSNNNSNASIHSGSVQEVCNQFDASVNLQPIKLLNFDGAYDSWMEFRDTFRSLIHENNRLRAIQKFHYLRGSLTGTAAQVIRSVEFSDSAYNIAWETLCERYNNTKILVHSHVKALFSLEAILKESSAKIRDLLDEVSQHLKVLEQLGQDVKFWDTLLIFIICSKLDKQTLREWEKLNATKDELPTFQDLTKFLKGRANTLETVEFKTTASVEKGTQRLRDNKQVTKGLVATSYSCNFCKENHSIYNCDEFKQLTVVDREDHVNKSKLCKNCLRFGHNSKKCRMGPCRKCKKSHNTLLHSDSQVTNNEKVSKVSESQTSSNTLSVSIKPLSASYVFLSTALIKILDKGGRFHQARALLDCGSQSSFIKSSLCTKLGLKCEETNLAVNGISNSLSSVRYKTVVKIQSMHSNFDATISCFVLNNITGALPNIPIDSRSINIPKTIKLADPTFWQPGEIDLLIGSDLFWKLLCNRKLDCGTNKPILQETLLGWIVSGQLGLPQVSNVSCNLNVNSDLSNALARFWKIEEYEAAKPLSDEENMCETIVKETTSRDTSGQFIVDLPLKQDPECLGESRVQAERQFISLERKLQKNPRLRELYTSFMQEYLDMGHMSEVSYKSDSRIEYFMPHHGVLREESVTTKLRVVFNASAPSNSGKSLNDIQCVGPILQDDLVSIILRFRMATYVVCADIAKMYRMVLVNPQQRNLQKIIWRFQPSNELRSYTLNTVTYGQASSSYLAIRCLFELASSCQDSSPRVAYAIRHCFYVDDFLFGSDDADEASTICHKVTEILNSAGFKLRKWHSNHPKIIQDFLEGDSNISTLDFGSEETSKTLGLIWSSLSDHLFYKIDPQPPKTKFTKRYVLSSIAKIFDPLGLLSPCIILAKIFMQRLWANKLSWDILPPDLLNSWETFFHDLPHINNIKIPRHVVCKGRRSLELCGFCDASEKAYGASIYLRSVDANGRIHVQLMCAKSKVAPIKFITIPRLELCAALLLARLTSKVLESLHTDVSRCFLWTDSTITLAWIGTSPNLLKTFVANRVSEIQSLTKGHEWKHVPSRDIPADLVSRGLLPSQIINSTLWWSLEYPDWPQSTIKTLEIPELKSCVYLSAHTIPKLFPFKSFSKFSKLIRTTAYILRFKHICLNPNNRKIEALSVVELNSATETLVRVAQRESFPVEFSQLYKGKDIEKGSKLLKLTPFLDSNKTIRLGGRLKHSDFDYHKKYPAILDGSHHFSKLLFESEHVRLLHAGPQLLLASIREQYWPIRGRTLARNIARSCVRCFRFKPVGVQPIMGNLPKDRLIPGTPFSVTGVDFAGPFNVRTRTGRGSKTEKCYACVFVCFSTKAIHLELVSSLSTNGFLLALRRLIARRGKPSRIYSDNGKNFVGAAKELGKFLLSNKSFILDTCASQQIDWHFVPPYTPHFGGLWEAAVKSVKYHMRRVLYNAHLTFEEFATALAQIEAVLNSRPLCPLSDNPEDPTPLTPAHFLIGKPMVSAPDEDVVDVPINRLSRYQLIRKLQQDFWQQGSKSYISELQQRTRWPSSKGELSQNQIVLIKDDQCMPMYWKLGRVIQVHSGSDGVARVASVKTDSGVIKRTFPKICPLPMC